MTSHPFHFAMLTHPGRVRKGNEDTCAASIESGAFVVCDGMGGAAAGEIASRVAADTFLQTLAGRKEKKTSPGIVPLNGSLQLNGSAQLNGNTQRQPRGTPQTRLETAIRIANQTVFQQARQSASLRGMGTTLVALLYQDQQPSTLTLAHVGDSRCYRFRDGALTLLTGDHSLVEEQVRSGELTPDQALQHPWRNIITRAVGSQATVEPDIQPLDPLPGDLYLLASDGLTRELTEAAIEQELRQTCTAESRPDLAILCQSLVDRANEAGGGDNITVLLFAIKESTTSDSE